MLCVEVYRAGCLSFCTQNHSQGYAVRFLSRWALCTQSHSCVTHMRGAYGSDEARRSWNKASLISEFVLIIRSWHFFSFHGLFALPRVRPPLLFVALGLIVEGGAASSEAWAAVAANCVAFRLCSNSNFSSIVRVVAVKDISFFETMSPTR